MTEATNVPKLKRSTRDSETREVTARRKAWAPPSRLDAPTPAPGYKHRWIRAESGGAEDRINVAAKLREGYELVRADEHPEFDSGVQDDGKHAGVISAGGLLLARIPEETIAERRAHYTSRTHDQIRAADNDLLKSNTGSSMKINTPDRQSKVSIGGPRGAE
tara:strand:- start:1613 stop:2098 length:486 start_codon:yes stop_codon:yes gene_type:complete